MKKAKRALSALLCVLMLMSVLPMAVLADGENAAKIGSAEYATLDEAVAAAKGGSATIELLANCETAGLNLSDDLTIDGGENKYTVTFKDKGIALWGKALTFKNCDVVMNGIGSTPYSEWNWQTICASKDASLTLINTTMTMDAAGVTNSPHAIYFCSNNKLNLTDSTLTIRNYPQDALEWDGGDGGYNVNLTNSTYISDRNRQGFTGTFYATFDNSKVKVLNSSANGSNGTYYTIKNDSEVLFDSNGYWGISAWRIDMTNGSSLTATNNGYSGIWTRVLNVDSTCTLDVEKNGTKDAASTNNAGIFFQGNGTYKSEIEKGANVTIKDNIGSGIYTKQSVCDLTIGSATIVHNGIGCLNEGGNGADEGGGVYNVGTLVLDDSVVLYNNHAATAGDDIYNADGASIKFGDVGTDWVLDDCGDRIDGWYEDGVEDDPGLRWNVHDETKEQHIVKKDAGEYTGTIAFKAAHGESVIPSFGIPILWLNMEDHYSYIVGYPDGTVQPNGKITRAEVATIFFRLLSDDTREAFWSSTNDYSDVSADKWYNNAVSTLSRLGVISGYPDGTFRPDASITRAEFAKIAVSFCKYGSTTYSGCFSDVKASDWFSTCVETAKTSNLIAGYPDGTFRPNNAITRAEACTIVNRTLGRKPAKNHLNISGRINWPDCADTDWFYADMMEATNSHDYQMVGLVEDWNRKLPQRDWAALETEWSHAYSAPGGEVGR